jgi:hypothetical protein
MAPKITRDFATGHRMAYVDRILPIKRFDKRRNVIDEGVAAPCRGLDVRHAVRPGIAAPGMLDGQRSDDTARS